jgi:hypothetical protein
MRPKPGAIRYFSVVVRAKPDDIFLDTQFMAAKMLLPAFAISMWVATVCPKPAPFTLLS